MSADGELDPSRYSRDQLVRALGRINQDRYPKNFEALTKELASRLATEDAEPIEVDSRPRAIRSAINLIEAAAWIQGLYTLVMASLIRPFPALAAATNIVLLALFIYQRKSLASGRQWVRASLILVLLWVGVSLYTMQNQVAWYSGDGSWIDLFFDLGRLIPIVLAIIQLFFPESTKWFSEQGQESSR